MDMIAEKEEEGEEMAVSEAEAASTMSDASPTKESANKNNDDDMKAEPEEGEDCDCSAGTPMQNNLDNKSDQQSMMKAEPEEEDALTKTPLQSNKNKARQELGGDTKRYRASSQDNKEAAVLSTRRGGQAEEDMPVQAREHRSNGDRKKHRLHHLKPVPETTDASMKSESTYFVDNTTNAYKRELTSQEKVKAYRDANEDHNSIADASLTSWKSQRSLQSHKDQLAARRDADSQIYKAMTVEERHAYNAKRRDKYHRQSQESRQKHRERERNRYHQNMSSADNDLNARNARRAKLGRGPVRGDGERSIRSGRSRGSLSGRMPEGVKAAEG